MDVAHVVAACFVAELTNCLKKRQNFDVANGATYFGDHYIDIVGRDTVDTTLNFIGDVGNDLYGFSEIVATALCGQHSLINRTSCCIGTTRQIFIDETFVVTQVEVGFAAIVGYKHFTMLKRIHGAWVDVDVRVELLHGDAQAAQFQ